MNFDRRTQILSKIQQLTGSQSDILHDLVNLNLIRSDELEKLINQLTIARFLKGQQYIKFARKLDSSDIAEGLRSDGTADEQVHIISRCYYGMYHLARAAVFHTKRADVDDHGQLAEDFSKRVDVTLGDKIDEWRKIRNVIEYSPYIPSDIGIICQNALQDAGEILEFCRQYLKKRGVNIAIT